MAAAPIARAAGAADSTAALILRKIPSSGEELPVIGLGTSGPFEVDSSEAKRAPLREVLAAFFAAGARLIDTSPMYSTAEAVLGDLLTPQMRQRAFLATKVWTRGETPGIEQMQRSAQLLRTQRLDLIQVHNLLDLDTHLKTLHAWKAAGRVRYVGVTHYTVSAHAELSGCWRASRSTSCSSTTRRSRAPPSSACCRSRPSAAWRCWSTGPFEDGALFRAVRGKPLPALGGGHSAPRAGASWR